MTKRATLIATVVVALGVARPAGAAPAPKTSLLVVIVVDQLASHYLTRWQPLLEGGGILGLARRGAYYPRARYAYANTETGPGHATLATGAWPSEHGIAGNEWYDEASGKKINCVSDPEHEKGPRSLLVPGLADALRLASQGRSKVVSVAFKDRVAVLLGGQAPTLAAWYDQNRGAMVTGAWPGAGKPGPWVNAALLPLSAAAAQGRTWDRLLPARVYERWAGPDDLASEDPLPGLGRTFPRTLGAGVDPLSEGWREAYPATPAAVEGLFTLVDRAITDERLGRGEGVDLLAIGVSSLDYAGHAWGAHAQETLDVLLRIDRAIAALVRRLDRELGGRVLYVVSADHGVLFTPEEGQKIGLDIRRLDKKAVARAAESVANVRVLDVNAPRLFLAPPTDPKADRTALRRKVAAALRAIPEIVESYAVEDLMTMSEPWRAYFARSYVQGRSGDVVFRTRPQVYVDSVGPDGTGVGTGHGSPYVYDMTVPLIFAGPGVRGGVDQRPVEMTRVAPTISALLDIDPPAAALAEPLPCAGGD